MAGGRILIRPNRGWVCAAQIQSQECGNPDPDMTYLLAFGPLTRTTIYLRALTPTAEKYAHRAGDQSWLYVYWGRLYAVAMGAQRAADWVWPQSPARADV